jgi:hypothetical protein
MSQPIDGAAARELPPNTPTAQGSGWKLVEDAPTPEAPPTRDRTGAARGMVLILVGGGLFWAAVAVAIWFATH